MRAKEVWVRLRQFLHTWTLAVSMITGVVAYFVYASIPWLNSTHVFAVKAADVVQPVLIFIMLFITFCKINPRDLKFRAWHGWLLLFQTVLFILLALSLYFFPRMQGRVVVEGAMLCMICPTATAAAVVTARLGGDAAELTTYTILINLVASVFVPLIVPLAHPSPDLHFVPSVLLILNHVFPTLICPFFLAQIVRYFCPRFHQKVTHTRNLAFNLWSVTLPIAIAITTHSIVRSTVSIGWLGGIAAVSLCCCIVQFWAGRKIGTAYGERITVAQSLGQKNTIFAIWMGYTFLTPVSSVAGGFYSVWHNVYNSWQLYRKEKSEKSEE